MNNYISRDNYMLFNSGKVLSEPLPSIAPYTLRFLFLDEDKYYNPLNYRFDYGTWTQRSDTIWDWTYNDPIWTYPTNLTNTDKNIHASIFNCVDGRFCDLREAKCKIIDSETSGVTNMRGLFSGLFKLEGVEKIDTSNITDASYMFYFNGSAVQGHGSVRYVNCTLDFSKVKYYNGTSCHGGLRYLFHTSGADSTQQYRLTTAPNIIWPDTSEVGNNVDLTNLFYNQRNITNNYAGVVYPTYWQQISGVGASYTDACYRCGDLGNPAEYANIPGDLK